MEHLVICDTPEQIVNASTNRVEWGFPIHTNSNPIAIAYVLKDSTTGAAVVSEPTYSVSFSVRDRVDMSKAQSLVDSITDQPEA